MQKEPEQLVEQFTNACQKQDDCMMTGNWRRGNGYARQATQAARLLLAGGDQAIDLFATLLEHDDPSVQVLAAAYLLKERTEKSVAALRPLAEGRSLAALGAKMTLERYQRGDLEIHP